MDDNVIIITDENGKETEMEILFTFDGDDKNYVVCFMPGNDEEVYPFSYDDEGNLYPVEDEDELKMIEEVVDAFDGIEDEENN